MEDLPVKHTFIHFPICNSGGGTPRSTSAPPGLRYSIATLHDEKPSRQEPHMPLRRRTKGHAARKKTKGCRKTESEDDAMFAAYIRQARLEKWALIVRRALTALPRHGTRPKVPTRSMEALTPKRRGSLPACAFLNFVSCTLAGSQDFDLLRRYNVFREAGAEVEIWSSDALLCHPRMKLLLANMNTFHSLWQHGLLQVLWNTQFPLTLQFTPAMTVADVRMAILSNFRIAPEDQALEHLGSSLHDGLLSSAGVGPGSIIHARATHRRPGCTTSPR